LIAGFSAVIWPIHATGITLGRDTAVMVASALLLVPLFAFGQLGRGAGLFLVLGLVAYLVWVCRAPGEVAPDAVGAPRPASARRSILLVGAGLVALMFGARFLVDGAVSVARGFGVSEAFVGLTVVAVGTSLPELATSVIAAFRRQSEIAIGNIIGSNIFNTLGILGGTALIMPIPVADRFLTFDGPVMIVAALVFSGLLLQQKAILRPVGAIMLVGYAAYVWAAQG